METVSALTDDEIIELGLAEAAEIKGLLDSPSVDQLLGSRLGYDPEGREIISLRQYEALMARGARMEGYMMRFRDAFGAVKLGQASKYGKWVGMGYTPLELAAKARVVNEPPVAKVAVPQVSKDAVTIFKCSDRYPDCNRFFDTEKSRESHWRTGHGLASQRSRRRAKADKTDSTE